MTFNPQIHHRRSIRLKGYDYTQPGAYFITILAYQHEEIFGEIRDGEIIASKLGLIIYDEWFRTIKIRKEIRVNEDEFILMPNHLHGIVWIDNNSIPIEVNNFDGEKVHSIMSRENHQQVHRMPHSLSTFISGFKSAVTSRSTRDLHMMKIWQRNYFEHIIRNEGEFQKIWDYIDTNLQNWQKDQLYPSKSE